MLWRQAYCSHTFITYLTPFSAVRQAAVFLRDDVKIYYKFSILLLSLLLLLVSCNRIDQQAVFSSDDVYLFIWDTDRIFPEYPVLDAGIHKSIKNTLILSGNPPEDTAAVLTAEFRKIPEHALCIVVVMSNKPNLHVSSEWNFWFPDLWRNLDCAGRVLIADAGWADEFLNPVKAKKEDTVWVVNGRLGQLGKKLQKSFGAASCRFDEVNMVSRGIDGKTKTPIYSWYFLDILSENLTVSGSADIVETARDAATLTVSAHDRGVVSDVEEVLFFNRSEIQREEFRNFPNPVHWNGFAEEILIKADTE